MVSSPTATEEQYAEVDLKAEDPYELDEPILPAMAVTPSDARLTVFT
jgi:hypothetical protein